MTTLLLSQPSIIIILIFFYCRLGRLFMRIEMELYRKVTLCRGMLGYLVMEWNIIFLLAIECNYPINNSIICNLFLVENKNLYYINFPPFPYIIFASDDTSQKEKKKKKEKKSEGQISLQVSCVLRCWLCEENIGPPLLSIHLSTNLCLCLRQATMSVASPEESPDSTHRIDSFNGEQSVYFVPFRSLPLRICLSYSLSLDIVFLPSDWNIRRIWIASFDLKLILSFRDFETCGILSYCWLVVELTTAY